MVFMLRAFFICDRGSVSKRVRLRAGFTVALWREGTAKVPSYVITRHGRRVSQATP